MDKKIYVVAKGKKPGVYRAWAGSGQAQEQVQGVAGAKYKSFASPADAKAWAQTIEGVHPSVLDALDGVKGGGPGSADEYEDALKRGEAVVFSDGGSQGNPGPGGYGCVVLCGDTRQEFSAGFRQTTNNRMEIMGCIAGLEWKFGGLGITKKHGPVMRDADAPKILVVSDSRYVVDAMTKGWAIRWRARQWMRNETELAKNSDLWERMLYLCEGKNVTFRWVKGHAGSTENERCHDLAVEAAAGDDLPLDPGFSDETPLSLF